MGLLLSSYASAAVSAIVPVHGFDFIPDDQRSAFNSFEGLPDTRQYGDFYTEAGITVAQVNGDPNGIWTTFNPGGIDGGRSWYPDGGDFGYTAITLSSGGDFYDIGFLIGSGFEDPGIHYSYELWNDGALVQAGTLGPETNEFHYLGFGGGGFDTVLLRNTFDLDTDLHSGENQALVLDAIEVRAVPLPSAAWMFVSVLVGLDFFRRRAQARSIFIGDGDNTSFA